MSNIADEVADIFKRESDHKVQLDRLNDLLDRVFPPNGEVNSEGLKQLIQSVVGLESGSMMVSRQLLSHIVCKLDEAADELDDLEDIVNFSMDLLQSRTISYEEQICSLRLMLAALYEKRGSFIEAATVLQGIPAESGQKALSNEHKMELYLRICRLFLDGGKIVEAEQYITRAASSSCDDFNITLEYKFLSARVLDVKRKFIDAAQKFYEVSLISGISYMEKREALTSAIKCTILSSPGSHRTRMLGNLCKDDRTKETLLYNLLHALFLDKLVKTEEFQFIEDSLAPHQKTDEKGMAIVRNMMIEHNMVSVSKLYANVSFETLASLLEIRREEAEEVAVKMMSMALVKGTIDQIDGIVHFEKANTMLQWDQQILALCHQVNKVTDLIEAAHPEFAST